MKKTLVIIFLLSFSIICQSQILNAYVKVTVIDGVNITITLTNVNEISHTINVGGSQVIVMQMQDDVIGIINTKSY